MYRRGGGRRIAKTVNFNTKNESNSDNTSENAQPIQSKFNFKIPVTEQNKGEMNSPSEEVKKAPSQKQAMKEEISVEIRSTQKKTKGKLSADMSEFGETELMAAIDSNNDSGTEKRIDSLMSGLLNEQTEQTEQDKTVMSEEVFTEFQQLKAGSDNVEHSQTPSETQMPEFTSEMLRVALKSSSKTQSTLPTQSKAIKIAPPKSPN